MPCRKKISGKRKRIRECGKKVFLFRFCRQHWIEKYTQLSKVHKLIVWLIGGTVLFWSFRGMIIDLFKEKENSGKIRPISLQKSETYILDLGGIHRFPIEKKALTESEGFYVSSLPIGLCGAKTDEKTGMPDFTTAVQPMDLKLKIKKNKLYVSTTVRDLEGDIIARMKDSYWEKKPERTVESHGSSKHVEILDKKGNVAFRLEVDNQDVIHMRGYFIKENCGFFLQDQGMLIITYDDRRYLDSVKYFHAAQNPIKYCTFYTDDK